MFLGTESIVKTEQKEKLHLGQKADRRVYSIKKLTEHKTETQQ